MKYSAKITDIYSLKSAFSVRINALEKEFEGIKCFEESIEQLKKEMQIAENKYDLNRAAEIKYNKIPALVNEIETIKERIRDTVKKVMQDVIKEI